MSESTSLGTTTGANNDGVDLMPWAKYRQKPVVVEAILWDASASTAERICEGAYIP